MDIGIGELSQLTGVKIPTIRYYEQIGLIPPADRTESGYRTYTQADIHRLHFIRRARDLGFSVAEITNLLGLWNDKSRQSADVKRLAQQHIAELDRRIESMLQMTETLKALIHCCAGDERPDCPILQTLEQPDTSEDEPEERTGAVPRRSHGTRTAKRSR